MRATKGLERLRRVVASWPRTTLVFLAAAPVLAAILFSAVILLVVAVGGTSRWLDNDFNLAEAALIGDVGRLYRLLEMGQPIDGTYPLRDSEPFERKVRMYKELTPLDAAILGDRAAVLALLLERGVAGTPPGSQCGLVLGAGKGRPRY